MFGSRHAAFLEAELARKDKVIETLLNRLMARDLQQFRALEPDSFLQTESSSPPDRLYDETGLMSVDLPEE